MAAPVSLPGAPPLAPTPTHPPALTLLYATKGSRVLLTLLEFATFIALPMPAKPSITADWWATRAAGGRAITRGGPHEPPACANARATAVLAAALSDALGYAVLGGIAAPVLGAASVSRGRVPLLVAGLAVNAAPSACLWAATTRRASLLLYYVANALSNAVPLSAAALAMAADWLPAHQRAGAFALVTASLYLGILVGSAVGAVLTPATAAAVAAIGVAATAVAAWACVPESVPPAAATLARAASAAAAAATASTARPQSAARAAAAATTATLTTGLSIILRSPLYRTLVLIVVATGAAGAGLNELLSQYLASKPSLHFSTPGQAVAIIVFALGGLACQLVLLPALVSRIGEARTLAAGAGAAAILQTGLAVANSKVTTLAALAIGSGAGLIPPAAAALKANNAARHEQGAVQGALAAAAGVAAGVGPLLYGGVFYVCGRRQDAPFYAPSAPFLLGALLCTAAFAAALLHLQPDAGRGVEGCDSFGGEEEERHGLVA